MIINKNCTMGILGIVIMASATISFAHTTVVKKNTPSGYAERSELEGASGVVNAFSISHGCTAPGSKRARAVRAQAVLFPNGASSLATREDTQELVRLSDLINGNAIMSPKPIQDHNIFKRIATQKGPVPTFNSHGEKNSDNRAFHYKNGYLQTDLAGIVPFRSSFPTFKSEACLSHLTVRIAIANYCTRSSYRDDRADIWIGRLTEKFDDKDVVSVGFWPTMKVIRNLKDNPLPSHCGDGFGVAVTPSSEDIDKFLPIQHFWPKLKR